MSELEKLKEKIKRLEFVIANNSKRLKQLRPILRGLAKSIGNNSSDVRKILAGLYKYMDMEENEIETPEMNSDCEGSFI